MSKKYLAFILLGILMLPACVANADSAELEHRVKELEQRIKDLEQQVSNFGIMTKEQEEAWKHATSTSQEMRDYLATPVDPDPIRR